MLRYGVSPGPILALLLATCGRERPAQQAQTPEPRFDAATGTPCPIAARPFSRPAVKRLVAIGDLHGDLEAARAALRLAGAINAEDVWIGGELAVVQTGDILDRGDNEQAIIDLFEHLERDAAAAGGSFTWLLGNHELMNAAGDYRYVTAGGWTDFTDATGVDVMRRDRPDFARAIGSAPTESRARLAAFLPGGAYAMILAGQDVAVQIGDTLFSHAGFVPAWTEDIGVTNRATDCWLAGAGPPPAVESHPDGPVWTRAWGEAGADCAVLRAVLRDMGAAKMVVAHTPQLNGI